MKEVLGCVKSPVLAVVFNTGRIARRTCVWIVRRKAFVCLQNIKNLTIAALDPIAKIPEYKVCAVAVEAVD